jgi:hypothetical protein
MGVNTNVKLTRRRSNLHFPMNAVVEHPTHNFIHSCVWVVATRIVLHRECFKNAPQNTISLFHKLPASTAKLAFKNLFRLGKVNSFKVVSTRLKTQLPRLLRSDIFLRVSVAHGPDHLLNTRVQIFRSHTVDENLVNPGSKCRQDVSSSIFYSVSSV